MQESAAMHAHLWQWHSYTRAQARAQLVCALVNYSIQDSSTCTHSGRKFEWRTSWFIWVGRWGKESQLELSWVNRPTRCPGNFAIHHTPLGTLYSKVLLHLTCTHYVLLHALSYYTIQCIHCHSCQYSYLIAHAGQISLVNVIQSARRGHILSTARKWITYLEVTFTLWGFVQANSKMADSTAGQLSAIRVNKASAKVFEPRVTWIHCILAKMS